MQQVLCIRGENEEKTKDNPPSLQPSQELRLSKKAMVDKESKKAKGQHYLGN
jgi:hypothetical protein